jgi:hypothetical protein
VLGPDHALVAQTHYAAGLALTHLGDGSRALEQLQQAKALVPADGNNQQQMLEVAWQHALVVAAGGSHAS